MLILAISLGAVIGALSRYYLMQLTGNALGHAFPWGTLLINASGCFLMGVVVALLSQKLNLSPELKAFVTVGFLGSFTTFSAFSFDAVQLMERDQYFVVGAYIILSVVVSISLLLLGMFVTKSL